MSQAQGKVGSHYSNAPRKIFQSQTNVDIVETMNIELFFYSSWNTKFVRIKYNDFDKKQEEYVLVKDKPIWLL